MSFLMGRIVRNLARRIVFDPHARQVATKAGRDVADEAKSIARDKDPARAAGRSFKRALGKLQGEGEGSPSEGQQSPSEGTSSESTSSEDERR